MSEWIEHDGEAIPFKIGDKVECKRRDGVIYSGVITERQLHLYMGYNLLNPMLWAVNGRSLSNSYNDIIAYRIVNDGEEAKREARSELFKKMIEGVAPAGGEPKLPAPKKKVKVSG